MEQNNLKVDLGCGYKKREGFVRIDGDVNCKPDYVMDLEKDPIPLPDNSVEYMIVHHVLEHVLNFKGVMKEIYRVCQPGAIIDIRLPHPTHDTYRIDPTHVRPLLPESFRLLSQKHNQTSITNGGAESTLGLMWGVDFEIQHVEYVLDAFYDQVLPTLNQAEYIRIHREANNFCIETHTVLMAIK